MCACVAPADVYRVFVSKDYMKFNAAHFIAFKVHELLAMVMDVLLERFTMAQMKVQANPMSVALTNEFLRRHVTPPRSKCPLPKRRTNSHLSIEHSITATLVLAFSEESEQCLEELLRDGLQLPSAQTQFFRGRRTKKKVEKAFDGLTALGFSKELIEAGLSHAHDLSGALQYLCLYYSSADLPSSFRSYAYKAATQTCDGESKPQLTFVPAASTSSSTIVLPDKDKSDVQEVVSSPPPADNAKAWTLQYLNSMQDDDETLSPDATKRQVEMDLAHATAQLKGLKKKRKHEIPHWTSEIRRLKAELAALTTVDPPVPSISPTATTTPAVAVHVADEHDDDDEVFGLGMLSMLEASSPAPVIMTAAATLPPPIDVVMPAKWTGKSPRVQLQEYCHKQKWPVPMYTKSAGSTPTRHRMDVLIKRRGTLPALTICLDDPGGAYSTADAAKDAVATRVLYVLVPHLPLYRGLPPYYRDMITWVRQVQAHEAQAKSSTVATKAQTVDALFDLVDTLSDVHDQHSSQRRAPPKEQPVDDTYTVAESWDSEEEKEKEAIKADPRHKASRHALEQLVRTDAYQAMLKDRRALPIASFEDEIVATARQTRVLLVSGETGSGKSTQVPHFLLRDMLKQSSHDMIVCTQPRRIAAIGVAERVAKEMGQVVGQGLVGYHIRFEAKQSRDHCRLLFCTTGILLRLMQSNPTLRGIRYVIVDEIHERDVHTDVLLGLLRRVLASTSHVRIVLMSATLHADMFLSYFADARVVAVPGRLFPVHTLYLEDAIETTQHVVFDGSRCCRRRTDAESRYNLHVSGRGGRVSTQVLTWRDADVVNHRPLPSSSPTPRDIPSREGYSDHTLAMMDKVDASVINYDLIQDLVEHLVLKSASTNHHGAILIFLSGRGEIRTLVDQLRGHRRLSGACVFVPVHASLSSEDQHRVFTPAPPHQTKVIVSTNIAETSLTIDDVTVVIDAGRVKHMRHDAKTHTSYLTEGWISQANAK
ncbi:hypothetical protein B5M09_008943, partial [Aphanomyces astaci]